MALYEIEKNSSGVPTGNYKYVAGRVNSEKINEMYEAFPSDASASNQLVTESGSLPKTYGTGLNANNCVESGYYAIVSSNVPVSGFGFSLFVELSSASNYCHQTAKQFIANDEPSVIYVRKGRYVDNAWAWSSWQKLVTESDIGINSSSDFVIAPTQRTTDDVISNEVLVWIKQYGSPQSGIFGWMWLGNDYMLTQYAYLWEGGVKKLQLITTAGNRATIIHSKTYTV